MNNEYSLEITRDVMKHFNQLLLNPINNSETEIVSAVEDTITDLKSKDLEDYVASHIQPLEELLHLISDKNWKISQSDKTYVMSALRYFAEENDIIPDNTPVVGYLDDCIVIDTVVNKLKQQLEEHKEFIQATVVYATDDNFSIDDWNATKRKELFSRIRHRRVNRLNNRYRR